MITCNTCKRELENWMFYNRKSRGKTYKYHICIDCFLKAQRERRHNVRCNNR